MRTALVAGLIVLVAAGSAGAAPRCADWHTNLDEAREEAWERGVPMVVFLSRFD